MTGQLPDTVAIKIRYGRKQLHGHLWITPQGQYYSCTPAIATLLQDSMLLLRSFAALPLTAAPIVAARAVIQVIMNDTRMPTNIREYQDPP
jgi:hypothetical protein